MPWRQWLRNTHNTHDSTGVRDYIYVVDLTKDHVAAIFHLMANKGESIFNLGTGYSVLNMVKAFETANSFDK